MSGNTLNSMDQREREALINSLKSQASDDTGTFVNVSGDTMTGALGVPTLAATSTVSVTGAATFAEQVDMPTLATTSTASITGAVNILGVLTVGDQGTAGPGITFGVSNTSGTTFKVNDIERGFVSTNSTASLAFAVRVDVDGSANTIYYVPVYTGTA